MARYAPLLLLLAACSSSGPDDTLEPEGGSTTDVEPGGTADDDSGSEGSESGSTGEPAPEWPPECLEATPTEEATCMVAWPRVSATGVCGEGVACGDPGDWHTEGVELAWIGTGDAVVRTDWIPCEGEPEPWIRNEGDPAWPSFVRAHWDLVYGEDEIVYRCETDDQEAKFYHGIMPYEFGDEFDVCVFGGRLNVSADACCLASGTPTEASGLPTTPCED